MATGYGNALGHAPRPHKPLRPGGAARWRQLHRAALPIAQRTHWIATDSCGASRSPLAPR